MRAAGRRGIPGRGRVIFAPSRPVPLVLPDRRRCGRSVMALRQRFLAAKIVAANKCLQTGARSLHSQVSRSISTR